MEGFVEKVKLNVTQSNRLLPRSQLEIRVLFVPSPAPSGNAVDTPLLVRQCGHLVSVVLTHDQAPCHVSWWSWISLATAVLFVLSHAHCHGPGSSGLRTTLGQICPVVFELSWWRTARQRWEHNPLQEFSLHPFKLAVRIGYILTELLIFTFNYIYLQNILKNIIIIIMNDRIFGNSLIMGTVRNIKPVTTLPMGAMKESHLEVIMRYQIYNVQSSVVHKSNEICISSTCMVYFYTYLPTEKTHHHPNAVCFQFN